MSEEHVVAMDIIALDRMESYPLLISMNKGALDGGSKNICADEEHLGAIFNNTEYRAMRVYLLGRPVDTGDDGKSWLCAQNDIKTASRYSESNALFNLGLLTHYLITQRARQGYFPPLLDKITSGIRANGNRDVLVRLTVFNYLFPHMIDKTVYMRLIENGGADTGHAKMFVSGMVNNDPPKEAEAYGSTKAQPRISKAWCQWVIKNTLCANLTEAFKLTARLVIKKYYPTSWPEYDFTVDTEDGTVTLIHKVKGEQ